jgi:hypothetical protein
MRRFFLHLIAGGTLVMPFMILWTEPAPGDVVTGEWKCDVEKVRPDDGAVVRLSSRNSYDLLRQLERTEERYEVILDGHIVASEHYARSPATRWYTQEEAAGLYLAAGFTDIRLTSGFSFQPASAEDTLFCVIGTRPTSR